MLGVSLHSNKTVHAIQREIRLQAGLDHHKLKSEEVIHARIVLHLAGEYVA